MIPADLEIDTGSRDQIIWACSHLLGIRFHRPSCRMTLHLELALDGDHPLHTPKLPGEAHCYRAARLAFSDYKLLNDSPPTLQIDIGPDGEGDLGDLHGIFHKRPGVFAVAGSFPMMVVQASRAVLSFDP
ncbi:MAG TPA: hypothetical protein VF702_09410 [Allosphingosinicella sp.]|jgi:hypothetical protein